MAQVVQLKTGRFKEPTSRSITRTNLHIYLQLVQLCANFCNSQLATGRFICNSYIYVNLYNSQLATGRFICNSCIYVSTRTTRNSQLVDLLPTRAANHLLFFIDQLVELIGQLVELINQLAYLFATRNSQLTTRNSQLATGN